MENPKRLTRSRKDRMVGGVASGIGEYLNVDPIIIRILFIFLAFVGGSGIVAYIVLLFIMPEDNSSPFAAYEAKKKNPTEEKSEPEEEKEDEEKSSSEQTKNKIKEDFSDLMSSYKKKNSIAGVSVGVLLIVFGFYILLARFFSFDWFKYLFPMMILFAGVLIILSSIKYKKS